MPGGLGVNVIAQVARCWSGFILRLRWPLRLSVQVRAAGHGVRASHSDHDHDVAGDADCSLAVNHRRTGRGVAALVGLAFLSTALAYVIYFRILAAAGATNLLLVTFLIPVSALIGGWVWGTARIPALGRDGAHRRRPLAAIDGRLTQFVRRRFGRRHRQRRFRRPTTTRFDLSEMSPCPMQPSSRPMKRGGTRWKTGIVTRMAGSGTGFGRPAFTAAQAVRRACPTEPTSRSSIPATKLSAAVIEPLEVQAHGVRPDRIPDAIIRACQIIEDAAEPPALAMLAAAVGFSSFHFHRLFRNSSGSLRKPTPPPAASSGSVRDYGMSRP